MCRPQTRTLGSTAVAVLLSIVSFAQTDYSSNIATWKSSFPKEDVISYVYKEAVFFSLDPNAKPGESAVKARVVNEEILVPVKDFLKYTDGVFYNDEISIDNVKVLNSKNKEVVVQKLCGPYQSENIFHSDSRFCAVNFPLEEKGKAINYRYESNYKDIKFLTSFYFSHHNPAVERVIEFNIPSWLEIDLREFNFRNYSIEKKSVKENDITKVTYTIKNLSASHREPSSPNHALSNPHIICVSKAYTQNGQRKVLFESVKDLYGWYHSVCSEIGNKPEALKSRVTALTEGKKTDMEKIEAIYYWVQDNIRYIAFENGIMGFKPDAAQNVLNNKYGDCKGKANLLKEMLVLAGYDARLTWIGTSDLPYDYTLPSLSVDNHMICTVILNGKRYFLDGTESFNAINDYAQRIQGKQVLIEDGKNYIIDRIPEFNSDRNKMKKLTRLSLDKQNLKGTVAVEYNGESKTMLEGIYNSIRNDQKDEVLSSFLRRGEDNVVVSNVKPPNFADRQKPLTVSYDLVASNQITKAGKELYIVMDWDKEFSSMDFDAERKNDYEFSYKYNYSIQTELTVPDGYKVDHLPDAFRKTSPQYSFEGTYVQKGKTIVYTKTISINKPILLTTEFTAWNSFIKDINNFYSDQVVLVQP